MRVQPTAAADAYNDTFMLVNIGRVPCTVSDVQLDGDSVFSFPYPTQVETPIDLAFRQLRLINLRFAPSSAGIHTATVTIEVAGTNDAPVATDDLIETTMGRIVFNDILPTGMPFYNYSLSKKGIQNVISDCHKILGREATIKLLDDVNPIMKPLKRLLDATIASESWMHKAVGMNVVIEAGMSITLKAGGGFVVVGPAGVTISGTPVLINSGGSAGSGWSAQTSSIWIWKKSIPSG